VAIFGTKAPAGKGQRKEAGHIQAFSEHAPATPKHRPPRSGLLRLFGKKRSPLSETSNLVIRRWGDAERPHPRPKPAFDTEAAPSCDVMQSGQPLRVKAHAPSQPDGPITGAAWHPSARAPVADSLNWEPKDRTKRLTTEESIEPLQHCPRLPGRRPEGEADPSPAGV
jgi:hypothetical protein